MAKGVIQDFKTAVEWITLAAEHGNADAQAGLAVMYLLGGGVGQDIAQGHMLVNIAASNGSENAVKL